MIVFEDIIKSINGKSSRKSKRFLLVDTTSFVALAIDDNIKARTITSIAKRNDNKQSLVDSLFFSSIDSLSLSNSHEYLSKSRKSFDYVIESENVIVKDAIKKLYFWSNYLQQEMFDNLKSIITYLYYQDARIDALEITIEDCNQRLKNIASRHNVIKL